ncbi:hypothetical protein PCASD_19576 [Puccinia coronata f. sp. avenae]|uniref:Uncharacterized protein n=1 Tax=Puccinia coronata f. sp. avenae TaxID=200324 RepID=A0A2N5S7C9_9BASI|nr:hypothetical protein PCASD_22885 [Puccinia coronata f. sp. avenae]PLW29291.1 hypothetical protein PCASD_19576 [Puccinia coronata f. sp. avenae]
MDVVDIREMFRLAALIRHVFYMFELTGWEDINGVPRVWTACLAPKTSPAWTAGLPSPSRRTCQGLSAATGAPGWMETSQHAQLLDPGGSHHSGVFCLQGSGTAEYRSCSGIPALFLSGLFELHVMDAVSCLWVGDVSHSGGNLILPEEPLGASPQSYNPPILPPAQPVSSGHTPIHPPTCLFQAPPSTLVQSTLIDN